MDAKLICLSGIGVACQVPKEYEMKKIFPIIILSVMLSGCYSTIAKQGSRVEMVVRPVYEPVAHVVQPVTGTLEKFVSDSVGLAGDSLEILLKPTAGYTYMLLAIELNTNMSSLLIDKTKEKIVSYQSQVARKLTPGSFFFVIPPKVTNGETFVYDDEMGRMIRNYLTLGKYGIPVSNPMDAEYIIVINVKESLSKTYGLNYSEISFSINDKLDTPVYLASIRVESKSDRNFWYYATKKAKPVTELTMKGMTHIMAEGLPDAHGDTSALVAYAKSLTDKDKKEN